MLFVLVLCPVVSVDNITNIVLVVGPSVGVYFDKKNPTTRDKSDIFRFLCAIDQKLNS